MLPDNSSHYLEEVTEQLDRLLRGEKAGFVSPDAGCRPETAKLLDTVNRLVTAFNAVQEFIKELAEGNIDVSPPPRNLLASPFKQLQSSLLHLTWQAGRIAAGDFSQRVSFMGTFSEAFNAMVESLEEKRRTEALLHETQEKVKHLEGIIPICMYCKKIRDDQASWQQLEKYISEHSEARFSHGICPECFENAMANAVRQLDEVPPAEATEDPVSR